MAVEIERKFLVAGDGWLDTVTATKRIRQAYLSSEGPVSVRVRLIDECAAKLTIKAATNLDGAALSRAEFEYSVPIEDALAMLDLRIGRIIEKTRHVVPAENGLVWEVDVFGGKLAGLVMAEIELPHSGEDVTLPSWVDREVTADPAYGNLSLALGA